MLTLLSAQDERGQIAAFVAGMRELGYVAGQTYDIDYRFAPAGAHAEEFAKELLALQPDVILAFSTPVTAAFEQQTHTIPIVFIGIADAVG